MGGSADGDEGRVLSSRTQAEEVPKRRRRGNVGVRCQPPVIIVSNFHQKGGHTE